MTDKCEFLYRGVHAGHPAFLAASMGWAIPGNLDGGVTADEHNEGGLQQDSPFTSFTRRFDIARNNATKAGEGGIILIAPIGSPLPGDTWQWVWSPDRFLEEEVLLRGSRTGLGIANP